MKEKRKSKQRLLLVLPLLVLPFMSLLFWALGGGQAAASSKAEPRQVLNSSLPNVNPKKNSPMDKMGYYEKAASDSAKWKELTQNDPYYKSTSEKGINDAPREGIGIPESAEKQEEGGLMDTPYGDYQDPNEKKVYQKLAELEATLSSSEEEKPQPITSTEAGVTVSDIDRLEMMMQQMTASETEDPELRQLDKMLQTIVDIQHPERVEQRLRETSRENKGRVFGVSSLPERTPVSYLEGNTFSKGYDNGFYGLEEFPKEPPVQNAIAAVIHQTQSVMAGSTVKLRLIQDIYIEGTLIPKGHFVFGIATLNGERLDITIDGVRYGDSLFPVELVVYSMDGIRGLHIPGALSRKVAKESTARAVQGLGLTSFDTSLGAQVASAGIEATRNLLSKRAKLIRVTIKAGDRVLLKDEKQKNN